ncbi:ras and EF-hand domain-containing protein homolog isoform X3 [Pomacea canaliculata]|uniref:ras and EF-hand domain-containing protein homolog isoform X3 n=1 Tax=Pomacea canaliculata TaxID=400727 RepID=UPI000D739C61|nr:ras and EF-hand domain-containing protein homolog isoform X3 [Pomacea canaliculata]
MDSGEHESRLGALFKACDLDGSGFIDQQELSRVCSELSTDDLRDVFAELDKDRDGRISVEEFTKGFRGIAEAMETKNREKIRERLRSTENLDQAGIGGQDNIEEYVGSLDEGLRSLSCQEQVVELYQKLHTGEHPELLENFESILLGVIKDIRQYQVENERLEKTFKREKEVHDKHLRQLEEEMEQQMQKVEERVRKQEKERLEAEKAAMRAHLDSEINSLQQNLKRLQQEGLNKFDKEQEQQVLNMRNRLEDIQSENRTLKSELTDSQTNLALVRSELISFRQQFQEKCRELDLEKETVMDYLREQDNLTRQLHMLHDANRVLHDVNDDLRMAVETSRTPPSTYRRSFSNDSGGSGRSGSPRIPATNGVRRSPAIGDSVDGIAPGSRPSSTGAAASLLEELSMTQSPVDVRSLIGAPSFDEESVAEDIGDSGHSTLRDLNDVDTELDSVSVDGEVRRTLRRRKRSRQGRVAEEEEPDSHDETDPDPHVRYRRPASTGSRASARSISRDDSVASHGSRGSHRMSRRQLPIAPLEVTSPTIVKVTREPERMYKVVLAGDAAVGKSSFIVRLCKNKFVPNLSSTLGVDFQTKVLEVDGHTVALQLWDTAGQERFRSIAKSYFRRADGVLLLYDCTYERSFINVREWLDAIQDSSPKKIPIMLAANKTDQRAELQQQGRRVVRFEDGQRLSREIDALFIETSAKDGSNITEAVIELTRLLRTNEDIEVKTAGMQLQEMNEKKTSCCGGTKR